MPKKNMKMRPIPGLRVLLTNDDGINSHGLKVLEKIARTISDDIWIVAPELEQSGAGHSLTLHSPLRIRKINRQKFAVQGTPTDCVMIAINHLFKDQKKPGLLLSGVNHGANLGEDVTYSGTVAAAIEGTLVGIPSIALSQAGKRFNEVSWGPSERFAPELVHSIYEIGWAPGVLININFPDVHPDKVAGVEICRQGRRNLGAMLIDERLDARGAMYYWIGFRKEIGKPKENTDLAAVENGIISVTPLHLDLTHEVTSQKLTEALSKN